METIGTGAGKLGLTFQIGSVQWNTFEFFEANLITPVDISRWTFEFFIKKNPGARLKLVNLTLGNGISFLTYSDTSLLIKLTDTQSIIEEGECYFELRRTDLNVPLLYGPAYFKHTGSITSNAMANTTVGAQTVKVIVSNGMGTSVSDAGALTIRGAWNAASNLFPTTGGSGTLGAVKAGNGFVASSTSTTLLDNAGSVIFTGTVAIALVDNPGQTLSNWLLIPSLV